MGLFNFPADRPNLDYGSSIGSDTADWFLTSPALTPTSTEYEEYASSAQIAVEFVKAYSLDQGNIIVDGPQGEVTKIYWDRDDKSGFPVKVRTKDSANDDDTCYNIGTQRLIFTPSAGVLTRRGDCLHVQGSNGEEDCDPAITDLPLFDPVIPFVKMEAARNLFVDSTRQAEDLGGMADYVELIFQFSQATTFFDAYDKDFLIFNKKCRFWQNHNHRFYQGSKALSCTLNSEEWDEVADANRELSDVNNIKMLYDHSLGTLSGAPHFDTACAPMTFSGNGNVFDWAPGDTSVVPAGKSCAYAYFPSAWRENQASTPPQFDNAYGAYVTWNVGKNLNSLDADFSDFVEPLASNGVDRVYISGTATCDRHQGWVQGAWYSGIRTTKQVLQTFDSSYGSPTNPLPAGFREDLCDVGADGQY